MSEVPLNNENVAGWTKFNDATNMVVTKGPKEGIPIHRLTSAHTTELAQMFADFQNAEFPLAWLEDNKAKIDKFDINYDEIFTAAADKE